LELVFPLQRIHDVAILDF